MLCILLPMKINLATLFVGRQVRTWVVKCATMLFNLFCNNVAHFTEALTSKVSKKLLLNIFTTRMNDRVLYMLGCSNFCV